MRALERNEIEAQPLAVLDAAERLEAVLATEAALRGISALEILHLVPERRAIFRGQMADGRPVVLRLLMDARERAEAIAGWAEMQRAHARMATGPYRIHAPLALSRDGEVMVVGQVEGTPLLTLMWQQEPPRRLALTRQAAEWLSCFTGPTSIERGNDRRRWIRMAEEASTRQPHAALRDIELRLLQKMKQLGRKFDRAPWRIAITHGDFHPNNLLAGEDYLCAIDLGGSSRLPLYKDIARFLVHGARRDMLPSGRRRFGVDAGSFDIFCEVFAMSEIETTGFLPFMIAFEVLYRVEHPDFPQSRIRHARALGEALFEDLRATAKS